MIVRKLFFLSCAAMATCTLSVAQTGQSPLTSSGPQSGAFGADCSSLTGMESPECLSSSSQTGEGTGFEGVGLDSIYPGLGAAGRNGSNSVYRDTGGIGRNPASNAQVRMVRNPRPLTEFQTIVAASVGHIVPIYGEDLFNELPDTFAPVQRIPVTPEYVIGPGDEVLIRIWGQVNRNLELTVDRSGSIYIPDVGNLHVAGLPFSQLQSFIRSHLTYVYRNFDLNINLGQLRSIQVFVTGEAQRSGSYTISSLSTLVNAVFSCGGPGPNGSLRHIQLRRDEKLITDFDLYDLLLHGDKSKDAQLQSGDIIYFPAVGARVAVVGSVQVPAIYELRGGETAAEALALAGGISPGADRSSMEIERTENERGGGEARVAMDIAMNSSGLAVPLVNADLVRVRARVPRFAKTVILRGNVAEPGRFAWHQGMRIRDLIPDQGALLTKGYWLRREQLGLPVSDFQPILPPLTANRYEVTGQQAQGTSRSSVSPRDSQTINSGLFPQLTEGVPEDVQSTARGTQFGPLAASSDAAAETSRAQQIRASTNLPSTLGSGPHLVTTPQFPIETQVVRTSPDIDWSYAVVERVDPATLTTQLIPFNLGAVVVNHDESADLDLEAGDVVTIFSDADIRVPRVQQTKYVRLEGEFAHSGVYSVHPGETLRQLVVRAGGLTDQAYLYGSQFTRESTRLEQQQRLDEYVTALSYEIELTASNMSASVVSPQQAATANSSIASQRALISRLREARATGRIVLHINPQHTTVESLPDLPLEDGDRFIVPPVPSTVGVVGAVFDPNSFVYLAHRDTGYYLRTAGGPSRNADRHQTFIIRADGSVVSRQYLYHTLWDGSEFEHQVIYPGDTVVVPAAINKATFLRGLTDWSTVFSQFALGAAAVNLLR